MAVPPLRLAVCFDGTWNKVESRTNVARLFESILDRGDDGVPQLKFYDEGVGASSEATTPWKKLGDGVLGGIFGDGVQRNVLQAYCWLIEHYVDDAATPPEIYVFGFSRGAFTARLLAGLLGTCGLPTARMALSIAKTSGDTADPAGTLTWKNPVVQRAWAIYKPGRSAIHSRKWLTAAARAAAAQFPTEAAFRAASRAVAVRMLGVWDTVGRYGVPSFSWGSGFFKPIRFGDSLVGRHVHYARHAMAIDEHRADFNVRRWEGVSASWASGELAKRPGGLPRTDVTQRWFAGSHAQVGGGYEDDTLCHHPLLWMAQEASALGLRLRVAGPKKTLRFAPLTRDHLGAVIDSHGAFVFGLYRWISDPIGRRIDVGTLDSADAVQRIEIDPSVDDKVLGDASYRPVNLYHRGRLDLHSLPDTA